MIWSPFSWVGPKLEWMQVEVTTACTAACVYCPRTVYGGLWQDRFLSMETFARLRPYLSRARHVHLQGWGEPFLHPEFFRFAQEAKAQGCQVGATTNGMPVDEAILKRCLELQMDVLAFSLAGTDPGQDDVRRGTSFKAVARALETLERLKTRWRVSRPAAHVAYILLRSRLPELPRLPEALNGLGVEQVVISTLDYVPAPFLAAEVVQPATALDYAELAGRLEEVAGKASEKGMRIHYRLRPWSGGGRKCQENPQRALVVAADGGVSPCVFATLPVAPGGGASRRLSFGNVNHHRLPDIWASPAYRKFRRAFDRGSPPPACRGCLKLF